VPRVRCLRRAAPRETWVSLPLPDNLEQAQCSLVAGSVRRAVVRAADAILRAMDELTPAVGVEKQGFLHISIPVGMLQCNCSIIGDPVTREALVVDPGDEVSRILDLLGRHKLKVKAIVSTHAHIDHVGGLSKLHKYTGAPVMMHREDLPLYQAMDIQASFLGVMPPDITDVHQLLTDGDALQWGSLEVQVIHTPGHTPGSVSLYMPIEAGKITLAAPQLFAGDTLFAGSIGRTDLWGGSMEAIMDSLRGKLMALPDDTVVHPGHGPTTSIGEERQSNPFLVSGD
jgi:hydroxyacylglutathione hydrolase